MNGQMNKWIKGNPATWDLKSIFQTITFLSILAFLFFYFTGIRDRWRQADQEEFKGNTEGEIISIEPIDRIWQSTQKGTQILVDSYKVLYRYEVNGMQFHGTDIIPRTSKNDHFLWTILDRKSGDTFLVRFDLKDPDKSILVE